MDGGGVMACEHEFEDLYETHWKCESCGRERQLTSSEREAFRVAHEVMSEFDDKRVDDIDMWWGFFYGYAAGLEARS